MIFNCKHLAAMLVLLLAGALGPAMAGDSWLHITVDEEGRNGDTVEINLPFKMIEAMLPLIGEEVCSHGSVSISRGRIEFDADIDLKAMLAAIEEAEDAEYITIKSGRRESVHVAKEKGWLIIDVEDHGEDVKIRMKLDVVKACLTDNDEIDLVAAARALRKHGSGDLVRVEGEDESVRIWIDSKSTID